CGGKLIPGGQEIFTIRGISPSQGDVSLRQIKSISELSLRHGWPH
ncbi:MAG: hypothetical protein, partial [Olavius algarvensis spirochete endosymbiont]